MSRLPWWMQNQLDGKALTGHAHVVGDTTGLQATLDGKASTSHAHAIGDTTGLQTALDGKAASSHGHAIGDTTGLQAALDGKQAAGSYAAASHNHDASYAALGHDHAGVYQPVDAQLTDLAALSYGGNGLKVVRVNAGATAFELATPSAGGANVGQVDVDFGAFPGCSDASVVVTGQSGIGAGSTIQVCIAARATTEHSADECWLEPVKLGVGNIVAGTGFTVYAVNANQINEPVGVLRGNTDGGRGTRLYGKFAVNWNWA